MIKAATKTPSANWQNLFKSRCNRIGFRIDIPKAQLEYLSAVVAAKWDEARFGVTRAQDAGTIASANALVNKGFIQRRASAKLKTPEAVEPSHHELTPVGELLVKMLEQAELLNITTTSRASRAK